MTKQNTTPFPPRTRRQFLADVGKGVLVASVGSSLAGELGLSSLALAGDATPDAAVLNFGPMEPLVCLMQETPVERLLPALVDKLNSGTELRQLVAAAALANARTFGGDDYVGFHTLMAMSPAYQMARESPGPAAALPVFKVLYRNTNRINEKGGRSAEALQPVQPMALAENQPGGEALREAVRAKDKAKAEQIFAAINLRTPDDARDALDDLLFAVQDNAEVHRTVLPYRAWDLLDLVGKEHAHTMLRQSVRYCVNAERGNRGGEWDEPRTVLPAMLERHKLLGREPGTTPADDAWVERMSNTIFTSTPSQAADTVAAALAEGIDPACIGEALSLAANQLVLRDHGRPPSQESPGKPVGSVHGDSIGVHACDSANAWRNLSRAGSARSSFSCLILGAWQCAWDRKSRGGDFLNWEPLPVQWHLDHNVKSTDPQTLLSEAEAAIRGNQQAIASAIIHRYGALGHPERPAFELMLKYATSEDGSLHAEKYYRTASEEFANTRPAFRWRQLVALARVTASEFGRPAPGVAQARELLKV